MTSALTLKEFLAKFEIADEKKAVLIGRSYFESPQESLLRRRPVYSGRCLAHLRGESVIPSLDLLQEIGRKAKYKVTLSKEGEWLFICGRDIFGKSITSHNNPPLGARVVVINAQKECLGYGDVVAPLEEKKVVVRRIFDLGDLLRRERSQR